MDCERHEQLSLWLDGELAPEEERGFSTHLATCATCRSAREDLLDLRADLRSMVPHVDPFAKRRALQGILAGDSRSPWWSRRVGVPVPVLAALVIGFALALGLSLETGRRDVPAAAEPSGTIAAARPVGDGDLTRYDRGARAVLRVVPRDAAATRSSR